MSLGRTLCVSPGTAYTTYAAFDFFETAQTLHAKTCYISTHGDVHGEPERRALSRAGQRVCARPAPRPAGRRQRPIARVVATLGVGV